MTPPTPLPLLQRLRPPEGSLILTASLILCLVLDQATKVAARAHFQTLSPGEAPFQSVFLSFREAWNPGINFGILQDHGELLRWSLVVLAILASALTSHMALFNKTNASIKISAGAFAGGAIGNAVDRIEFAKVYDFLNISCCGAYNPYVFNLADVFIFVGLAGLFFLPSEPQTERSQNERS